MTSSSVISATESALVTHQEMQLSCLFQVVQLPWLFLHVGIAPTAVSSAEVDVESTFSWDYQLIRFNLVALIRLDPNLRLFVSSIVVLVAIGLQDSFS